jgi:hypothetical protein
MFGSGFGGVEADETWQGIDPDKVREDGTVHSGSYNRVMTLIDRETGRARSFVLTEFTAEEVARIFAENVAKEAYVLTDEASTYKPVGEAFQFHGTVHHGKGEYVSRDAPWVHTNTVEGYYSVFKRGMKGVYQHCGKRHLHRYCTEFDFRYSTRAKLGVDDVTRFSKIVEGVKGKRLTYRATDRQAQA